MRCKRQPRPRSGCLTCRFGWLHVMAHAMSHCKRRLCFSMLLPTRFCLACIYFRPPVLCHLTPSFCFLQSLTLRLQNLQPIFEELRRDVPLLPSQIGQQPAEQLKAAESELLSVTGSMEEAQRRLQGMRAFNERKHRLQIIVENLEGQYVRAASKDGAAVGERLDALRVRQRSPTFHAMFLCYGFRILSTISKTPIQSSSSSKMPPMLQARSKEKKRVNASRGSWSSKTNAR